MILILCCRIPGRTNQMTTSIGDGQREDVVMNGSRKRGVAQVEEFFQMNLVVLLIAAQRHQTGRSRVVQAIHIFIKKP